VALVRTENRKGKTSVYAIGRQGRKFQTEKVEFGRMRRKGPPMGVSNAFLEKAVSG